MGMGDTCYTNFVPSTMDEFESRLYIYYFSGLNQYLNIQMKFKSISVDNAQGNNFLHKSFGHNAVRQHKEFKSCFDASCIKIGNCTPS